jgi:hypothetical protein
MISGRGRRARIAANFRSAHDQRGTMASTARHCRSERHRRSEQHRRSERGRASSEVALSVNGSCRRGWGAGAVSARAGHAARHHLPRRCRPDIHAIAAQRWVHPQLSHAGAADPMLCCTWGPTADRCLPVDPRPPATDLSTIPTTTSPDF